MSVSQRKTGAWVVKFKDPCTGVWKSTQFKKEEDARAFDSKMAQEYASAKEKEELPMTLGDLTVAYFKSSQKSDNVRQHVVQCLCGRENNGKHLAGDGEFLRDKIAQELTRRDLERLRDSFRTRNVSNNSINHYQAYISAILPWGADQELITHNPWAHFKKLPVRAKMIEVSIDAFRKVYERLPEWWQWAAKTAYCLALRPGIVELFRLPWSAFDWTRGIVRVRQGKTGMIKTVVPPDAYLAEARERYEQDMQNGIELVCTNKGHKIYSYHKSWGKACKLAGVEMRPYDIRHLAASGMLAGGADLAAVAAQLGHASVTTTGRVYAHVVADAQGRAARALPQL